MTQEQRNEAFDLLVEGFVMGHTPPQWIFDTLLAELVRYSGGTLDNKPFVEMMREGLSERIAEAAADLKAQLYHAGAIRNAV